MTYLAVNHKINQLPPNLRTEVEDYIDFLLQKQQKIQSSKSSEANPETLTLEQRQQMIPQAIPVAQDFTNEEKDNIPFLEKLLTLKISAPSDFAENIDAYLTGEKSI